MNYTYAKQIADYLVEQVVSLKIAPGERIMEEKLSKSNLQNRQS